MHFPTGQSFQIFARRVIRVEIPGPAQHSIALKPCCSSFRSIPSFEARPTATTGQAGALLTVSPRAAGGRGWQPGGAAGLTK